MDKGKKIFKYYNLLIVVYSICIILYPRHFVIHFVNQLFLMCNLHSFQNCTFFFYLLTGTYIIQLLLVYLLKQQIGTDNFFYCKKLFLLPIFVCLFYVLYKYRNKFIFVCNNLFSMDLVCYLL